MKIGRGNEAKLACIPLCHQQSLPEWSNMYYRRSCMYQCFCSCTHDFTDKNASESRIFFHECMHVNQLSEKSTSLCEQTSTV